MGNVGLLAIIVLLLFFAAFSAMAETAISRIGRVKALDPIQELFAGATARSELGLELERRGIARVAEAIEELVRELVRGPRQRGEVPQVVLEGALLEVIVEALVQLAHRLGLTVTAECVETSGQAERLRRIGCDTGQGWLYSRPVGADRISVLLGSRDT